MTSFTLKIIALTTMIIDHFGSIIAVNYNTDTVNMYTVFRSVGRIAFPIYAFLVAEGASKTRNMKKYALRLFVFGLISEFPFDLLFSNIKRVDLKMSDLRLLNFDHQNVFFTLALGVLAIYLYELCKTKKIDVYTQFFLIATVIYLGEFLKTDYGCLGISIIFFIYILRENRLYQILAIAIMLLVNLWSITFLFKSMLLCGASVSLIVIYFYNGRKGRNLKWLFYLAYPLHIIILFFIWYYFVNLRA